jgi:hypothetical protein
MNHNKGAFAEPTLHYLNEVLSDPEGVIVEDGKDILGGGVPNPIVPAIPIVDPIVPTLEPVNYTADEVTTILSQVEGGVSVNTNGEVLDAQGAVIASKDDVTKLKEGVVEPQTINLIVNGKEASYSLNTNGDAVDAAGNIVATKSVLAAAGGNDTTSDFIENFQVNNNLQVFDETGAVKKYSDTEDGLKEYVEDVIQLKKEEIRTNVFQEIPRVQQFLNHLLLGGTEESFFSNPVNNDWSSQVLNKNNTTQLVNVLKQGLVAKGIKPDMAEAIAVRSKDSSTDELYNDASAILKELQDNQKANELTKAKQIADSIKARQDDEIAYWNSVEDVIVKTGVLNIKDSKGVDVSNIQIPTKDKEGFYKYFSANVENGKSQEMIDRSKEDLSTRLGYAYLRYKGFNIKDVADLLVKRQNVQTIKQRFVPKKALTITTNPEYHSTKVNLNNLSISNIQ